MFQTIGIAGSGLMGTAIAEVNLLSNFNIILFDSNSEQLNKAKKKISSRLDKNNQDNKEVGKIKYVDDISSFKICNLVIECVIEDEKIKAQLLDQIGTIIDSQTILATNTSSISINRLSKNTKNPANFIGLHFMNPPQIIKLVEIIPNNKTNIQIVDKIKEYIATLNMQFVMSDDQPGFIVNRVLIPMINEAAYALESGLSDAQSIDKALKSGANFPMGPLQLADFIGLDTCLYIMQILTKDLENPKYKPCHLLEDYVRQGKLGRKTGEGFYKY
ncbi:MAG: 3-hydroxyacyl-CoA dehydrogenase family protein [Hyphomicrobiales bacterium]